MSRDLFISGPGPVRILSDLHLAHPASLVERVEAMRPLISGAGTVIFNGDTCEQSRPSWREAGRVRLAELEHLCAEEGATPVFLAGNHDPEITERGWLELMGGKVLVAHGHAIYATVAPWSHEFLEKRREIRQIIAERRSGGSDLADHWETTRLVTDALRPRRTRLLGERGRRYLLSAFWPPERCFNILCVWLTMVRNAESFMQRFRPDAEVLLFGHFHRSGIWQRGVRTLCNTGAFMRGAKALVAELENECLRISAVTRVAADYRIGKELRTVRVATDADA